MLLHLVVALYYLGLCRAVPSCLKCEALEWLTHRAYGIEFSTDGMFAVAHGLNAPPAGEKRDRAYLDYPFRKGGTQQALSFGSAYYHNFLLTSQDGTHGFDWNSHTLGEPPVSNTCWSESSVLSWGRNDYHEPRRDYWRSKTEEEHCLPDRDANEFHCAMEYFKGRFEHAGHWPGPEPRDGPLMKYVGISIPGYTSDSIVASILDAAHQDGLIILNVNTKATAVAVHRGVDLQHIPSKDNPSDLIMVLGRENGVITASLVKLPLDRGAITDYRHRSLPDSLKEQAEDKKGCTEYQNYMTRWIDGFIKDIDLKRLRQVYLTGTSVRNSDFQIAVKASSVGKLVMEDELEYCGPDDGARGQARIVADKMKEYEQVCLEDSQCRTLYDEAQQLVAKHVAGVWTVTSHIAQPDGSFKPTTKTYI